MNQAIVYNSNGKDSLREEEETIRQITIVRFNRASLEDFTTEHTHLRWSFHNASR